jgi:hypothetical protein
MIIWNLSSKLLAYRDHHISRIFSISLFWKFPEFKSLILQKFWFTNFITLSKFAFFAKLLQCDASKFSKFLFSSKIFTVRNISVLQTTFKFSKNIREFWHFTHLPKHRYFSEVPTFSIFLSLEHWKHFSISENISAFQNVCIYIFQEIINKSLTISTIVSKPWNMFGTISKLF